MVKKWKTDFSELHDKTRNAFRAPSFNFPLNKGLTLLLAVIIVVGGLSYFGVYKPGQYTAILEKNTTDLQAQLDDCNSNYQSCSDDLATSKASLIEKSNALSTCNTNFDDCDKKKKECQSELTYCEKNCDKDCEDDLENCEDDLKDCEDDYDDYKDDCDDEKKDLEDIIDELEENYAEDYCCELYSGETIKYEFDNNEVECNTTSGTEIDC